MILFSYIMEQCMAT